MGRIYKMTFINDVLRAYPKSKRIKSAIDEGSDILGRYLCDGCENISPDDVYELTEKELKQKAERIKLQEKVYAEFLSGDCYLKEALQEYRCPLWYLRDKHLTWQNQKPIEDAVCGKRPYFLSFYDCKNWSCKQECWKRYEKYLSERDVKISEISR